MKKFLLLFAIPFYLFACKDSDDKPSTQGSCNCDTLTADEIKKFPELKEADVKSMADNYYKLPHNIDSNILRVLTIGRAERLRKLLYNQKSMRLITAAYLADNANGKKNQVTIIIQLWPKTGYKVYYDIKSVFPEKPALAMQSICPLPPDCIYDTAPEE